MNRLGISYTISPQYLKNTEVFLKVINDLPKMCFEVRVTYKNKIEYYVTHCFQKIENSVDWIDSDNIKREHEGIFAYLGDKKMVDLFFWEAAINRAKKYWGIKDSKD